MTERLNAEGGSARKTSTDTSDSLGNNELLAYIEKNPQLHDSLNEYLSRFWKKYGIINPPNEDEKISLPAVYIALNTQTKVYICQEEKPVNGSDSTLVPSENSYLGQRISIETEASGFHDPYLRSLSAVEMLEYAKRLVLLGAPGSGKSTFLQYLALCMAGEILERKEANLRTLNGTTKPVAWPHGALLPIYVELRNFACHGSFPGFTEKGLAKHLTNYIKSTLLPGQDLNLIQFIKNQPNNVLLMLDGLDEAQDASGNREQIREVIVDFAKDFPDVRILITSRVFAYQDPSWRLDHAGFYDVRLADLTESQSENFIRDWYYWLRTLGEVDEDLVETRIQNLISNLKQYSFLKEFASNPFLLTLVVGYNQRHGGMLPVDRINLYEESVISLLIKWNRQRELTPPEITDVLGTDLQMLRIQLEEFAFEIHRSSGVGKDRIESSYNLLRKALVAISTGSPELVERMMRFVHQRSGIIVAESPTDFRFPHRSIQEYLAGCYLVRHSDYPDKLAQLAKGDPGLWREVAIFAAKRAASISHRDVWGLVQSLCSEIIINKPTNRDNFQVVVLVGLILAETGTSGRDLSSRDNALLQQTREWLISYLDSDLLTILERYEVGRILGQIGDPRKGVGLNDEGIPDISWIEIPAGTFLEGSVEDDTDAIENEKPQKPRFLDRYYISKFPVTVAQFRAFIATDDCSPSQRKDFRTRWRENPNTILDNYPVVLIDYNEAKNFCDWLSRRLGYKIYLPREAEWEKAARGTEGYIYPWGNTFSNNCCNTHEGLGKLCAVGMFHEGESPYMVMDMSGNQWEWTSSLWNHHYGVHGDTSTFHHVIRGGSYDDSHKVARCAHHGRISTADFSDNLGFRVITYDVPK